MLETWTDRQFGDTMGNFIKVFFITFAVLTAFTVSPVFADPVSGAVIGSLIKKFIINAIVSAVIGAMFNKKGGNRGSTQAEQGLLVNKNSSNDPIPVVYGRTRTGGTRVYMETSNGSGDTGGNNILNVVLVLCEGQMGDLKKVWFNDEVVFEGTGVHGTIYDGDDDVEGNKFEGTVEIQYFDGRDDQTVSTLIQNSVGSGNWSNDHRLRGVCYIALKLTANAEKYNGGLPLITCEMAGKRIKNVTTDAFYSSADQNPVDVLYDYLTDTTYGKGLSASDIDIASFQQARTDVGSKYPINGPVFTDLKLYENINKITSTMNGLLIYTAGTYKLKIQKSGESTTRTLTKDEIIGSINISGNQKGVRLNKITINYNNRDSDYNEDAYILQDSTYLAQDSNQTFETNNDIELIVDEAVIDTIAQYKLDDSRVQITLEFEAPHTLLTAECGDIVGITHDAMGYTDKPFRIQKMELTPENTVKITARIYRSEIQI